VLLGDFLSNHPLCSLNILLGICLKLYLLRKNSKKPACMQGYIPYLFLSQNPIFLNFVRIKVQKEKGGFCMVEIEMKVNPSYVDDELGIGFEFEFKCSQKKIGEAFVITYAYDQQITHSKGLSYPKSLHSNKQAVIKHFDVITEYKDGCVKKLMHFLNVIGISSIHELHAVG
jgi:hypothetical protein